MNNENTFGQALRRERLRAGMTVRELGDAADIPSSSISRLETGEVSQPKPRQLQQLARALNTDLEELYAAAGYLIQTELPALKPYLRAKYGLSDQALTQVEGYVQALRDQPSEQEKGQDDGDKDT